MTHAELVALLNEAADMMGDYAFLSDSMGGHAYADGARGIATRLRTAPDPLTAITMALTEAGDA